MTTAPTDPTDRAEELLTLARALGPLLEQNSREAELQRHLPEVVVEELRRAGFFWLKTPRELGGSELDPVSFGEVMEEIAYHDASAAWATMIGSGTIGTMAGWLPEEGVAELFVPGQPLPTVAGQFTPRGTATPTEGGYRVSGRWAFGSGIDHSNWVVGGCIVEGSGEPVFVTAPKSEVTVHGNWDAAALQGTGSHDFSFDDVFVPASRVVAAYGGVPRRGGDIFKQPIMIFISNELSPLLVGIARRAIDDMIDLAASTTRSAVGSLAERASFRKALGEAEARWAAARTLYRATAQEGFDIVRSGGEIDEDTVAVLRARHTLVAELCAQLIGDLFRYGGGRVLSVSHPMQRHLRNALGALQHVYLSEENYEVAGVAAIARRTDS